MEQDWSWNRPALDYMELYHAARKLNKIWLDMEIEMEFNILSHFCTGLVVCLGLIFLIKMLYLVAHNPQ